MSLLTPRERKIKQAEEAAEALAIEEAKEAEEAQDNNFEEPEKIVGPPPIRLIHEVKPHVNKEIWSKLKGPTVGKVFKEPSPASEDEDRFLMPFIQESKKKSDPQPYRTDRRIQPAMVFVRLDDIEYGVIIGTMKEGKFHGKNSVAFLKSIPVYDSTYEIEIGSCKPRFKHYEGSGDVMREYPTYKEMVAREL
mmetsp:Transcript_9647/g.14677  ORF Transcript_9647/g.14677 Transcript_9647/m.14677 type:complete len:193 (-) Transcript_9647:461-1039(-)